MTGRDDPLDAEVKSRYYRGIKDGMSDISALTELILLENATISAPFNQIKLHEAQITPSMEDVGSVTVSDYDGYEFNGVYHNSNNLSPFRPHFSVRADHAKLDFISDSHARLYGNNNDMIKYREGGFDLYDAFFIVHAVQERDEPVEKGYRHEMNKRKLLRNVSGVVGVGAVALSVGGCAEGNIGSGFFSGVVALPTLLFFNAAREGAKDAERVWQLSRRWDMQIGFYGSVGGRKSSGYSL
ncbi:MAG: hypothetical protein ABIH34_06390 [Nanoarchaeota archaeon]